MKLSVTVIMSVYNGEKYLAEAVESILQQSFLDFEFLIVDDCSTDSSLQILSNFQDSRIKLLRNEKNLGLTKSLNKALQIASGKYIARMDADDISHVDRLEKQIQFLELNQEIVGCGTFGQFIHTSSNEKEKRDILLENDHEKLFSRILFTNQFIHGSIMIRRSSLQEVGAYDELYKRSQDYDLWLRLLCSGRILTNLEDKLYFYRISEDMVSCRYNSDQEKFAILAMKNCLKNFFSFNVTSNEVDLLRRSANPAKLNFIDAVRTYLILSKLKYFVLSSRIPESFKPSLIREIQSTARLTYLSIIPLPIFKTIHKRVLNA